MPKISALPPLSTADDADEAPIVDTSVTTTKKWTLALLKTYLQAAVAWISTAMLADSLITGAKIATTAIRLGYSGTIGGSTTSASFGTATNGSIAVTVPAGGRSVKIEVCISVGSDALMDWRIRKDGTTQLNAARAPLHPTGGWTETVTVMAVDSAPTAGAHTYTFEFARAAGGGTVSIGGGIMIVTLM